jgi:hypothetical protein
MLFSDSYGIQRTAQDDWFDPFLNLDTKLFIDPFLLYDDEAGPFVGSHADVILNSGSRLAGGQLRRDPR